MTAISPYAPPRRNLFLHHPPRPPQHQQRSGRVTAAASVGLLLLVIRFWKNQHHGDTTWPRLVRRLLERLRPVLVKALKTVVAWMEPSLQINNNRYLLLDPNHSGEESFGNGGGSSRRLGVAFSASNGDDVKPTATDRTFRTTNDTATDVKAISDVEQNQSLIQKILFYWFARYPPDEAQKQLWIISEQSESRRTQVDHDICHQFASILVQLCKSEDARSSSSCLLKEWCNGDRYGYQGKLAAVIVLDQFSRHMLRYKRNHHHHGDVDDDAGKLLEMTTIPNEQQMDQLALETAQLFVQEHASEITCGMIPTPMHIFALMPFRHAGNLETVQYVQQQIQSCHDMLEQQWRGMLGRFRKATTRRMAVLQDLARSSSGGGGGNDNVDDSPATRTHSNVAYSDEDILECFPFQVDDKNDSLYKHAVHQTIRTFLTERGIKAADACPIIVSLSGGVDSMVIAAVLAHLNRCCQYHLDIVAVHIDYANRPESSAEAYYVKRYCEQVLEIRFECRRIDEVTRGVTARDEYERMSRDIRYSFYRDTIQECRNHHSNVNGQEVGVVLGHHRGDLRENVLSNAHKGCGPLDLSGMTAMSRNNGVTLYRPLLSLEKSLVFDYAHTFGVPYFKDTTPHWSTRGKLRNKLLPLLEEIYGEGSMNRLSSLAAESDECRDLVHGTVLKPFLDQVSHKPMGIQFGTGPWKEQALFFWKFVLRETLHSAGLGMFSDKSVVSFLERVRAPVLREGWMQCRKDYGTYLRKDGTVFVFYPASFPWRASDTFPCQGLDVCFGDEVDAAVQVGPWEITAQNLKDSMTDREAEECLETRAIFSMEDLMEGSLEYYLEVPAESGHSRPLVFTKFTKATRPKAWKSVDLKVQEALPLLGNDEESLKALTTNRGMGQGSRPHIARVTLRLESKDRSLMV